MRKTQGSLKFFVSLLCLVLVSAVFAWAQTRKPGLYEITSTMTWQQSPMPNGMAPPAAMGGPRTNQVCVTQAMIDKYGAPMANNRDECQVTNVQKSDHGMTAEMVCSGHFSGKGTVAYSWVDSEHSTGKVHFTGQMQMGPNTKPIEWTSESTSTFKSADCGSVKPIEPKSK